MADLAKLVEELSQLSVLEASELVKLLEEKWGVSAAAPVAAVAAGPAAAAVEEEVEEKTEFTVVIKNAGAKKIEVIKVIRQLTSLGLVEAKTSGRDRRWQSARSRQQGSCERRQGQARSSWRRSRPALISRRTTKKPYANTVFLFKCLTGQAFSSWRITSTTLPCTSTMLGSSMMIGCMDGLAGCSRTRPFSW